MRWWRLLCVGEGEIVEAVMCWFWNFRVEGETVKGGGGGGLDRRTMRMRRRKGFGLVWIGERVCLD